MSGLDQGVAPRDVAAAGARVAGNGLVHVGVHVADRDDAQHDGDDAQRDGERQEPEEFHSRSEVESGEFDHAIE